MTTITIEQTEGRAIRFEGQKLAYASGRDFDRDATRYTFLALYRTDAGTFVLEDAEYSQWQDESSTLKVHVVGTTEAEVVDWLEKNQGLGRVQLLLLDRAEIEAVETIT